MGAFIKTRIQIFFRADYKEQALQCITKEQGELPHFRLTLLTSKIWGNDQRRVNEGSVAYRIGEEILERITDKGTTFACYQRGSKSRVDQVF